MSARFAGYVGAVVVIAVLVFMNLTHGEAIGSQAEKTTTAATRPVDSGVSDASDVVDPELHDHATETIQEPDPQALEAAERFAVQVSRYPNRLADATAVAEQMLDEFEVLMLPDLVKRLRTEWSAGDIRYIYSDSHVLEEPYLAAAKGARQAVVVYVGRTRVYPDGRSEMNEVVYYVHVEPSPDGWMVVDYHT